MKIERGELWSCSRCGTVVFVPCQVNTQEWWRDCPAERRGPILKYHMFYRTVIMEAA